MNNNLILTTCTGLTTKRISLVIVDVVLVLLTGLMVWIMAADVGKAAG